MRTYILAIALVFALMIIPTVFAAEFDNVKSYAPPTKDQPYGTISVINAFGLGSKLADATLLNNTDVCGSPVRECYAIINLTLYSPYTDAIKTPLFKDKAGTTKSLTTYNLQLKTGTDKIEVNDTKITPQNMGELIVLVNNNVININPT